MPRCCPVAAPRFGRFALLLALVLCPLLAQADPYVLRGTVRDPSGNIVPGVKVVLQGAAARAVTGDEGEFTLTATQRPTGKVSFSRPGYGEQHLDLPEGNAPMTVTLRRNQNDEGLVRYSTSISLSHSLTTVHDRERARLGRVLTQETYRDFIAKHGELPAEEVVVRIYLPRAAKRLGAILLISEHGIGGPLMEHPLFRQFADRHGIALVGVIGDPVQRGMYPAEAFESLLAAAGNAAGHPEISHLPMFTFGHSNGTGFSVLQAALRPERVIGWISFQSGASWHLVFPGIENCPGLVMHGQKDRLFVDQDKTVAMLRRERNAPVSLLVAGDAAHQPANLPRMCEVVIAFYEACLRVRAPQGLPLDGTLARVRLPDGWLGGSYDRSLGGLQFPPITPFQKYPADVGTANWLPDETFARQWQRFIGTGSIAGESP